MTIEQLGAYMMKTIPIIHYRIHYLEEIAGHNYKST